MRDVVNAIARRLQAGEGTGKNSGLSVDGSGSFLLSESDASWTAKMLLGALDYFDIEQLRAMQITPDREHWTIDVPDMREPLNPAVQPIWHWLETDWSYPVTSKSKALQIEFGFPILISPVSRWFCRRSE